MIRALSAVGIGGLLLTVLPSVFYLTGGVDLSTVQTLMLIGTVVWYAAAVTGQAVGRGSVAGDV